MLKPNAAGIRPVHNHSLEEIVESYKRTSDEALAIFGKLFQITTINETWDLIRVPAKVADHADIHGLESQEPKLFNNGSMSVQVDAPMAQEYLDLLGQGTRYTGKDIHDDVIKKQKCTKMATISDMVEIIRVRGYLAVFDIRHHGPIIIRCIDKYLGKIKNNGKNHHGLTPPDEDIADLELLADTIDSILTGLDKDYSPVNKENPLMELLSEKGFTVIKTQSSRSPVKNRTLPGSDPILPSLGVTKRNINDIRRERLENGQS